MISTFSQLMTDNDWKLWQERRKVCLWEAICLAFDCNPAQEVTSTIDPKDKIRLQAIQNFPSWKVFTDFLCDEKRRRLRIAEDYLTLDDGIKVLWHESSCPQRFWQVDLHSFVLWAVSMKWSLPKQLTAAALGDSGNETAESLERRSMMKTISLPYVTKELEIIFETMKRASRDKIEDSNTIVELLGNVYMEQGFELTESSLKAIAPLLVPNHIAESDGRSRINRSRKKLT